MDPRQKLYEDISATIKEHMPIVAHVGLWNEDVTFVEQDAPWSRPAVFVEFGDIEWERVKATDFGKCVRGRGNIRLHVVTDWTDDSGYTAAFKIIEDMWEALEQIPDDSTQEETKPKSVSSYSVSYPTLTQTNHNHEGLLENIETFQVRYLKMW